MDLAYLYPLIEYRIDDLISSLKVQKSLSLTQSRLNILAGRCLRFITSSRPVKTFLSFLDIIDSVEIKGLPKNISFAYTTDFIQEYFTALQNTVQHSNTSRVKDLILAKICEHVCSKAEVFIDELICRQKRSEKSKHASILYGYTNLTLSYKASEFLFCILTDKYFSTKLNLKHEEPHSVTFQMSINLLKSTPDLFLNHKAKVAMLFKKAQGICRKYIQHKTTKDRLYLLSCEFIVCTLTNAEVAVTGLPGISLPATFGKTCYAESYLSYFIRQTYMILKRASVTARLLMCTQTSLAGFMEENQNYLSAALGTMHSTLKVAEEPVFVPYILSCQIDLPRQSSSELIGLVIRLFPESLLKSVDSLLTGIHTGLDEEGVHWITKIAENLPHSTKVLEIVQGMMFVYKTNTNNDTFCAEIVKLLMSIAERFPQLLLEEVIFTASELLIGYEKQVWIRNNERNSEELRDKGLGLLHVGRICANKGALAKDSNKMAEFWTIISHILIQYPVKDFTSPIDLNENLVSIAKSTPIMMTQDSKSLSTLFTRLSQADQYSKVFFPKLKGFLSSFASKK
jgi:hypothetical protein